MVRMHAMDSHPPAFGFEDHDVLPQGLQRRLVGCLVTPVDGGGRGSIGISVSRANQRTTAAFLCDLRSGVCDALGEVEPESPVAGSLLDELAGQTGSECAETLPSWLLGCSREA